MLISFCLKIIHVIISKNYMLVRGITSSCWIASINVSQLEHQKRHIKPTTKKIGREFNHNNNNMQRSTRKRSKIGKNNTTKIIKPKSRFREKPVENNKDAIKAYQKEYHQTNKEAIKAQTKAYRQQNKVQIAVSTRQDT